MSYGPFELTYAAAQDRYEKVPYRRTGESGLDLPAFSVQYHPEAAAGPHDAAYLFDRFCELMDGKA